MLGAMRPGLVFVAIVTSIAVAACGGSSQSSSATATGGSAASSSQTTASSPSGAVASTATFSASGVGAAVTTTSTIAPPEVPKAKKHARHGGTHAVSQGAHVETNVAVDANGGVTPPVVSVPSGVAVELHITNHSGVAATVELSVPSHPGVHVAPSGRATLQTAGLKDGTYRILVNGTPRGQLMIGAQGGP
jgi:hypothetical protein